MVKKCRQKSNVILIRCTANEQSHLESHVLIVQKAMPVHCSDGIDHQNNYFIVIILFKGNVFRPIINNILERHDHDHHIGDYHDHDPHILDHDHDDQLTFVCPSLGTIADLQTLQCAANLFV